MKKSLKFTLLTVCCLVGFTPFSLSAQDDEGEKPRNYKVGETFLERVSFTPQVGWLHSWGDFKTDGFMPSFLQSDANELGFGLNGNYNLSRVLTISGGLLYGELSGSLDRVNSENATNNNTDYGFGILYRTDLFEVTLPRLTLNATRLIFKDKSSFFNKASINIFASHGLVYYDSKIYAQGSPETNLLYSKERGRTGQTTEAVTTFGGSFTYILNDKFDISLESSIRNVYNDKLDAWVAGDYNDKYSYTAVGITYHLKKRKYVTKNFNPEEEKRLADEVIETPTVEENGNVGELVIEEVKEEEVEDDNEIVDLETKDEETVFGVYTYNKLPGSNVALVVLDENGIPIDTIYTDANGMFEYSKLKMDEGVSFVPLNYDPNDDDKIDIYLSDKDGNRTKELTYDSATGGYNLTDIVADEVKEEEKEEIVRKDPTKKDELKISEGSGYYVTVAAFRSMTSSRRMVDILKKKGEDPSIIRNRRNTWNLITISRFDNKKTALKEMKKARNNGYPNAWVHIKPEESK